MIEIVHIAAAILASWRLTDLITLDRISVPFRRRFPHYLWSCPRCVSVWASALCLGMWWLFPYGNWVGAMAWLYLVQLDWRAAKARETAEVISRRLQYEQAQRRHGVMPPIQGGAELWSGILDPARAMSWEHNVGVEGGIPSATWTQCATVAAGASAATINAAIAACNPSGSLATAGFVQLAAGTFNVSSAITLQGHPNVVLRGMGPLATKIVFASGSSTGCQPLAGYVCLGSTSANYPATDVGAINHSTTWTAGYAQGATVLTFGSVAGLSATPGSETMIVLDQDDDASDTGNVVMNATSSTFVFGSIPDTRTCNGGTTGVTGVPVSGCTGQTLHRGQMQHVKVTAINGNQVTISPGLFMPNWRSSQNPGAWWASQIGRHNGLEDLTLDLLAITSNTQNNGVEIGNCYECWMRNVRSLFGPNMRAVIQTYNSGRTEIRDNYLYSTHLNGSAQSYGFEVFYSGATLVVNSISHHHSARWLIGVGSGNAVAYNYSFDDTCSSANSPPCPSANFFWADQMDHDISSHNLYEGNQGAYHVQDTVHGPHMFHTDFRNQYRGNNDPSLQTKTSETSAEIIMSHSRYAHVIGSVLGTTGYHNTYQTAAGGGTANCDRSIYAIGFTDTSCQGPNTVPLDTLVATTLMRWGNCDAVTGGGFSPANCKFDSSEVPSGLAQFPNAVPAIPLPPSFLFAAQPTTWWGPNPAWGVTTPAWPIAGPDVTGGNVPNVGGLAYKNPARLCFENAGNDPAYTTQSPRILNFDAATCYQAVAGTGGGGPTGDELMTDRRMISEPVEPM